MLRQRVMYKRFIREYSQGKPLQRRKAKRTGKRKKLNCSAVAMENLANPSGSSGPSEREFCKKVMPLYSCKNLVHTRYVRKRGQCIVEDSMEIWPLA